MPGTVIYGPPATGKTKHAALFAQHYGCGRILEGDEQPVLSEQKKHKGAQLRHDDMILTTDTHPRAAKRFPGARLIGINEARAAIGLDLAPAKGFCA